MGLNNVNNVIIPEVLKEANYIDWSIRLRTYLQAQDVWDVIEEEIRLDDNNNKVVDKSWRKKNAIALYAIHMSCGAEAFSLIRDLDSAKEAWHTLGEKYEQTSSEPEKESEQVRPQNQAAQLPNHYGSSSTSEIRDVEQHEAFFDAVRGGNLNAVKNFLNLNPDMVRARVPYSGKTALHIASDAGDVPMVEELVSRMKEEDLEITGEDGFTALLDATVSGVTRIAECMVKKNKHIVMMEADNDRRAIPIEMSLWYGHKDMSCYLYSVTPVEELFPEKGAHGATIINRCIRLQYFDIALDLLQHCPGLAVALDHWGRSPVLRLATVSSLFPSGCRLRFWEQWIYNSLSVQQDDRAVCINVPHNQEESQAKRRKITCSGRLFQQLASFPRNFSGIQHLYEMKLRHLHSSMLLRCFCEVIQTLNKEQISNGLIGQALCESVTRGTLEFFLSVTKAKPELISYLEDSGKDIFMLAVQFRQPKIYCLIHGINASKKARVVSLADDSENSILDMAGFLAPSTQLSSIQGAALQMQRELQWFKEVESIVPPQHIDGKNAELMTARESFTKNHADLMIAGEKWMKDIAGSCSVVSSLIVTIMFAVAFAVPGGYNQNTGFPMFLEKKWFKIFIISDAISLFSSTAAVLMFLGILTSRYAENDFLKSLPTKLMIGLSTLFFSIATMTLAFVAAIFIMLRDELQIIIPILLLASLPVALFVWMQFPLLIRIFNSTYGPSIFDRKIKRWF